jgi:hypothetical protein
VVWLDDTCPTLSDRLVEGFEQNIGVASILCCNLSEESISLRSVLFCMVVMPINDDIDTNLNGGFHNGEEFRLLHRRILQVSIQLYTQGSSHNRDMPIITQPANDIGCPIGPLPLRPKERHAPQAGWLSMLVDNNIALDSQLSMLLNRRPRIV